MKASYIIFGIVGLVILWLISRMGQSAEPQVVAEFIGAPEAESGASQADAQTRLGVFQTLASLAQSANEAILQRRGIDAQLEATRIGAAVQARGIDADRALGERQIAAQEGIFLEDLRNRAEGQKLHLDAVRGTLTQFRGISTASTGVLLNALGAVFDKQPTYSYTQAFGEKQQPWYAPITQGIGRLIGGAGISIGF